MSSRSRAVIVVLFATILVGVAMAGSAQIPYRSGQNVAPVFEGWQRNLDGTFDFIFGYMNRNHEEVLDIPIGPDNNIQPGGPDRGQPTHFYTRRNQDLFKVRVPKDWDRKQRLVWTVTAHGRTDTAKAWLQPEWEVDASNETQTASGEHNKPPVFAGGETETLATAEKTIALSVTVSDDGVPKPRRINPAADVDPDRPVLGQGGVTVRWIQFRGPGRVTFEPSTSRAVYGQPVTMKSTATFSQPGNYVLMAIARDGQLESQHRVAVTVK